MKKTNLQIAVIGCGVWGMNHLRVWREIGCLRVACDADTARLSAVQQRFAEVETSCDANAVLQRSDIQAVVLATPVATHSNLALQALAAGKDVLVEKPMALTAAEGEILVQTARRLHRILMVGHVLAYHPVVRRLKELIAEGTLGRVQYIYSNRLNLGRIRTEENALWSFAPHDIDLMLRLLGTLPESVACHGGSYLNQSMPDMTLSSLSFPGNVRTHIFVSWLHPFKEHRFVVVGDSQMAVFDDTCPWPEKLLLYPHRVDWLDGQIPVARKAEGVPVSLPAEEPLRTECDHFLHCMVSREPPLTDGVSGLRVLRVLEAGQRSLEQDGGPVPLAAEAPVTESTYVHPTSTVDPEAAIGTASQIWHYSHVMPGATIGQGCILGQNVFVGRQVSIGNGVKIQNNVSIYEGVELEDYVFCGPSMVFTNVINPRSEIERKQAFRQTRVKHGATLGANCTVLCGTTIGRYALVGAGAVVTKEVPDYALVVGVPARLVGWVCACGHTLQFTEDRAICSACQSPYRRTNDKQVKREKSS